MGQKNAERNTGQMFPNLKTHKSKQLEHQAKLTKKNIIIVLLKPTIKIKILEKIISLTNITSLNISTRNVIQGKGKSYQLESWNEEHEISSLSECLL